MNNCERCKDKEAAIHTYSQQSERRLERIAELEAELGKCTTLMDKYWPASMSCNGILLVSGHLSSVFEELAKHQWVGVDDRMPEKLQRVSVVCCTKDGKRFETMAEYVPKREVLHEDYISEDSHDFYDYEEETNTNWAPAGWYEWQVSTDTNWYISEGVTHWKPIVK